MKRYKKEEGDLMNILELFETAKKSEHGLCWFSEKGAINISKDGVMTPAFQNLSTDFISAHIDKKDPNA